MKLVLDLVTGLGEGGGQRGMTELDRGFDLGERGWGYSLTINYSKND